MKKWLVFFLAGSLCLTETRACDACGCGPGTPAWGIMPNYHLHFIGFRTQWRTFRSVLPDDSSHPGLSSDESFLRAELVGRYALHRRWQFTASMPYRSTSVRSEEGNVQHAGIGDVSAGIQFLPILPAETGIIRHALQFNLGMEAPTGRFSFSHDIPAIQQPGSGTWDALAGASYTIRVHDFGFNGEFNWKRNGTTQDHFHPGNTASAIGKLFYTYRKTKVRWIPSLGASYEEWQPDLPDTRYAIRSPYTGGQITSLSAGLDIFTPGFALGIDYGQPISQDIADGWTAMNRSVSIRFLLFISSESKTTK